MSRAQEILKPDAIEVKLGALKSNTSSARAAAGDLKTWAGVLLRDGRAGGSGPG
ncbi:MAG: hypothetical protein ABW110_22765 [Steroidobacteraceae bacterium]